MSKTPSGSKRLKGASKVRALLRAQQINELLKRSTIESEALQSSGDDRPITEEHIRALLEEDAAEKKLQHNFNAEDKKIFKLTSSKPKKSAKKSKPKGKKSR